MVNAVKTPGKVKLLFTLLIGAGLVWLTFSLGQWQTGRAQEKQTLFDAQARALAAEPVSPASARLDLDNLSYRKIELRGRFEAKALIYIDNRQVNGRPAVQVVQGFRPEGANFLIPVDRGLLLRNPAEPRLAPNMPAGAMRDGEMFNLQGTILPRFAQSAELRGIALGDAENIVMAQSNGFEVWSNFSVDEFEKRTGEPVSNFVVTQQPVAQTTGQQPQASIAGGFYHLAVPLQEQVAKHRGYAFQWFTMSAVLVLLTLFFVYREFFRSEFYKGNKR
ncbi:SURF1 family protein [Limnobacter profundi]|jgi:surfeit locus 1 family protein|uniref:SURF1-like protein n=1 Tax=Limnobacter profundi TaxID=2732163 RepID=A0ABX6N9Y3_9BURK|nr:SURF1 family protein [Limnobacter sp. SAORIC-580]QJR30801.1 SURF1 family protein [Limnobacter sp. SAORIC-580]